MTSAHIKGKFYLCIFARFLAIFFLLQISLQSSLAQGISTIEDAEIQQYIRTMLNEVLASENLPADGVNLHLVHDFSINAFVYDGMNVFVNLGLIISAESPEVIYGVLAHECGHIKGVHLVKTSDEIKNSAIVSGSIGLASLALLALGGGGANGGADLAQAGILAAGQVFNRTLLSFTRTQEREADAYALQSLKKLGIGTDGIVELFTKLKKMQSKYVGTIDKYSVTHPLSDERIDFFKQNELQNLRSKSLSELNLRHCLISAKINGFFGVRPNFLSNRNFLQNARCNLYYKIFTQIGKKQWRDALAFATTYKNEYINGKNTNLDSFFYETLGDINFGLKNFNIAAANYNIAYQNYQHEDFLLKHYQSRLMFETNAAHKNITEIKNIIKGFEQILGQTESLAGSRGGRQKAHIIINQLISAYRQLAAIDYAGNQHQISANLYLALYYNKIGKVELSKQIFENEKLKISTQKLTPNQTNTFLLTLMPM